MQRRRGAHLLVGVPAAGVGVSGVARPCSRASDTGASHRLGSGNTPAASMCAVSRSYCVLYGASCNAYNVSKSFA